MEQNRIFAVVETDARQQAAGAALRRMGFGVAGAEETALADYILLPLPLDDDRVGLAQLLKAAKPGALALGGRVSARAQAAADEAGVELIDYFARPELATLNAIPTAEGCVGILLAQRKRTLWGSAVLLLGFGPVGQAVGTRLAALGAHVTVAARRPAQRAQAESLGMQGADDGVQLTHHHHAHVGVPALQISLDAGERQMILMGDAEIRQGLPHQRRRALFLEAQFGVGKDLFPDGNDGFFVAVDDVYAILFKILFCHTSSFTPWAFYAICNICGFR